MHIKNEYPGEDSSSNDTIISAALRDSCTANTTAEKIEFDYLGENCVYLGNVIEKNDTPAFDNVRSSFQMEFDNGNLSWGGLSEIILHFTDTVHESVKWDEYFIDSSGDFHYHHPKRLSHSVAVSDTMAVLPVGTVSPAVLDSSLEAQEPFYRAIRIVCEFEDKTMEYVIFFDNPKIEGFVT